MAVSNFIIGSAVLTPNIVKTPSAPALTFTQGDAPTLNLYAQDQNGNPINLSGATFSTQINGANGVGAVTFGNSQHTIVNASTGQFQLTLATTDTQNCGEGQNKSIVTSITIGGSVLNFWGNGILQVLAPNPAF